MIELDEILRLGARTDSDGPAPTSTPRLIG